MLQTPPVKIARVISRLNIGGPAVHAVLLTEALCQRGYSALLLTGEVPLGEASMDYFAQSKGVKAIKISHLSRGISAARDLRSLLALIRIFIRERPTIVHTHTAKAGTLGRIAAVLTRVPVRVHTFHGHVFSGYFPPAVTRVLVWIERVLARFTDQIVTVSESQKRELAERYKIAPAGKISVIPLGFEVDAFASVGKDAQSVRAEAGYCTHTPVVTWIGRLTAVKDPGLFIRSAAVTHIRAPEIRFILFGDGELRDELEQAIQSVGLKDIVQLRGWRRQVAEAYAAADLVLMTSRNEGTPLVLLEAMAAAKPFVATNVGGIRDLMFGAPRPVRGFEVFANGILTPRDEACIADAVVYLFRHRQLLTEMGCAGKEFASRNHSYQRLADDIERLYLRLIRNAFPGTDTGSVGVKPT